INQIVDLIYETVDPESWRDRGLGDVGTIEEYGGNLIITQTPGNHRHIEGLLSQLREIRSLQINVETRVLDVDTTWFEQIGVDLDLYFNTNNTMFQQARAVDPNFQLSDFFGPGGQPLDTIIFGGPGQTGVLDADTPNPFNISNIATGNAVAIPIDTTGDGIPDGFTYAAGTGGFSPIANQQGFSPIGVTQGSLGLAKELFGTASVLGPAATVGLQFLDDIQVDLLIEATQADRRTVVMSAPRLTFFNGERAWIAVATATTFVSALNPIVGTGGTAFTPVIDRVFDGFVLDIQGVVSADRRYVNMTVIFASSQIEGFDQGTTVGQASGGGTLGGGAGQPLEGQFELPIISGQNIRTSVMVPDKGTLLLGGARQVREIEVETGVPVLSKIPFINRFFTNRITSKDESSLLILLRPEIIIQAENEDMLFPGLSDQLGGNGSLLR
ncbi:MAG: hypothetical protein EA377_05370, partial [Phycisphaerales bacterium]